METSRKSPSWKWIFWIAAFLVGPLSAQSPEDTGQFFPPCKSVPGVEVRVFKGQRVLMEESVLKHDHRRPKMFFTADWEGKTVFFTQTAVIRTASDWKKYWKTYFGEVPEMPADLKGRMVLLHPGFASREKNLDFIVPVLDRICEGESDLEVHDHFASVMIKEAPLQYPTPVQAHFPMFCSVYAYILPRSDKPVHWITVPSAVKMRNSGAWVNPD